MIFGYFLRACFLTCTQFIFLEAFKNREDILRFLNGILLSLVSVVRGVPFAFQHVSEFQNEKERNMEFRKAAHRRAVTFAAIVTVFPTMFICFDSHFFAKIIPEQEWKSFLILFSLRWFPQANCSIQALIDKATIFIRKLQDDFGIPEIPRVWQILGSKSTDEELTYMGFTETEFQRSSAIYAHEKNSLAYLMCFGTIVEEIIFRSLLISFLENVVGIPIWICGIVSMLFYGACNKEGERLSFSLVGALCSFAYIVSGTYLAIFVHFLFNMMVHGNIKQDIWLVVVTLSTFLLFCF